CWANRILSLWRWWVTTSKKQESSRACPEEGQKELSFLAEVDAVEKIAAKRKEQKSLLQFNLFLQF
ncbi:hypothetical protein, partial [Halanaerobium congolense]|uniref:hypothetical protein n=1 Tax=Halanaerobium congolense TaxID=54121 RepID=UPI001AAD99FE